MKKGKVILVVSIILVLLIILVTQFVYKKPSKPIDEKQANVTTPLNQEVVKTENESNVKYSETIPETAKYKIYDDVLEFAPVTNMDAYKTLYDAIDQLKESVDVSKYTLEDTEIDALILALFNRSNFELFYIKDIKYDKSTKNFNFKYTYQNDGILKMKQEFNDKVKEILDTCVKPNRTDLENEIEIYKYISENVRYNYEENTGIDTVNAYSIIVNGKGICMGYANAIHYLFDLAGIPSRTIVADEPFHMWNIVMIDDKYYHVDATWEDSSGNGLKYFNMTDAERNEGGQFIQKWYGGNSNYKRIEPPICDDNRFKFMRTVLDFEYKNNLLYYIDQNDWKMYKAKLDGENRQSIGTSRANELVIIDDWIYYSNQTDKNKLYKIQFDGSNDTKVLDNTSAFELRSKESNIQYSSFDADGETEIHILELK